MSSEVTRAPLKGVWALMGEAWGIYAGRFWSLAAAVLAPILVIAPIELLIAQTMEVGAAATMVMSFSVIVLNAFVGTLAATIILMDGVGVVEAYKRVPGKFAGYFWVRFLKTSAIMGGILLGIIPGILLSMQLLFSQYIFLEERKRGVGALLQSRGYVAGYWWAVYGRILGVALILISPAIITYLPMIVLVTEESSLPDGGFFTTHLLLSALYTILLPLAIAFKYALYRNLKELKPDLAQRASEGPRTLLVICIAVGFTVVLLQYFVSAAEYEPKYGTSVKNRGGITSLILNPDGFMRGEKNNRRAGDLQNTHAALQILLAQSERGLACKPGTVFTSDAGTTEVNGTGWLPADFTAGGTVWPGLEELPRDPVNVSPFVYSFACDSESGEYELNAVFDPKGVPSGEFQKKAQNDGGNNPDVYEVGSNLNLIP